LALLNPNHREEGVADLAVAPGASASSGEGPQSREPTRFDLEYFENFGETFGWTAPCKQHNVAFKWWRLKSEEDGQSEVYFDNDKATAVAEIVHAKTGTDYTFNRSVFRTWHWQEMVAQLNSSSMQIVVEGPQHHGAGKPPQSRPPALVSCSLKQMAKYDHKRHVAEGKTSGNMLRQWEFVLHRDDGSAIYLKPDYTTTKVSAHYEEAAPDLELPVKGLGGSDGPGTFKRFKNKGEQISLRFDGSKNPQNKTAVAARHKYLTTGNHPPIPLRLGHVVPPAPKPEAPLPQTPPKPKAPPPPPPPQKPWEGLMW